MVKDGFMVKSIVTVKSIRKAMARVWLTTGRVVRNYSIEARIAASGTGEVYLAKELQTKRQVALKILPAPPQCTVERLKTLAAQINNQTTPNHPGFCKIYEAGVTEDGKLFVASEYVSGHSLDTLMQARVSLDVVKIAEQIAEALEAAHVDGRVHADLKLNDIMLTAEGTVKILDFGLAKYKQLWQVLGKDSLPCAELPPSCVRHFAPEHINGLPITPQTDLFSLGTILYEMIAGEVAFSGATRLKVGAAIVWSKPQPLANYARHTTSGLRDVIARLLEKDQTQRTLSAEQFLADLRRHKAEAQLSDPHVSQEHYAGLSLQQAMVSNDGRMVADFGKGVWHVLFNDGANMVILGVAAVIACYALLSFLSIIGLMN